MVLCDRVEKSISWYVEGALTAVIQRGRVEGLEDGSALNEKRVRKKAKHCCRYVGQALGGFQVGSMAATSVTCVSETRVGWKTAVRTYVQRHYAHSSYLEQNNGKERTLRTHWSRTRRMDKSRQD